MTTIRAISLLAMTLAVACQPTVRARPAADDYFADWPAGTAPAVVGRRVAANFAARAFTYEAGGEGRYESFVSYSEAATWYGALNMAKLAGDEPLRQRLIRKFDHLRTAEGARRISAERHVDFSIFGAVPLELFIRTKDSSYLTLGRPFADRQWENPAPDGITREARYWADDMFMVPLLQLEAYRATGEPAYLDRVALAMSAYLDSLQQPTGLFYHGAGSPFYWGRGNGWIAAGMTELLRSLPPDHPRRPAVMRGYRRMMEALMRHQSPGGLWRQLIDKPELWTETSGSAMFAFAMVSGVKEGWLDGPTYGPAARRAWIALVSELDAGANLRDICVGTGKAAGEVGADIAAQYAFYVARPRRTGDLHGQAPMLWTAAALLR